MHTVLSIHDTKEVEACSVSNSNHYLRNHAILYSKFKKHTYQICLTYTYKRKARDHKKYLYAHGFSNFPELNNTTNSRACKNHPRGVIVKQIKEDNKLTSKAHNNGLCRESFHRFIFIPKLDIWEERK